MIVFTIELDDDGKLVVAEVEYADTLGADTITFASRAEAYDGIRRLNRDGYLIVS